MKVDAPVSSASGSMVERVACRTVVATPVMDPGMVAEPSGERGLVVDPAEARGIVGAPIGESGLVAGFSETVAFGRDVVEASGDIETVGVTTPGRGVLAVLSAMVGAPMGVLDVASLMVGTPAEVGAVRGLVGDPMGTSGLVAAPDGARGIVGAPVAMRGGLGATVAVGGFGAPAVAVPAVLRGMVGAGAGAFGGVGGPATGAVVAAVMGRGALLVRGAIAGIGGLVGADAGIETVGAAVTIGAVATDVSGGTSACTGITGLGVAAGTNLRGAFGSVGGKEAEGTAGGASEALSVTLTVSFFKGTLEVCSEGGVFSLMLMRGFLYFRKQAIRSATVKHASLKNEGCF